MTRRRADLVPTAGIQSRVAVRGWIVASLAVVAVVAVSEPAAGCAVCYGAEDSAMTAGMNNAILLLLGVVAVVQGSFAALFLSLRQRARRARSHRKEPQAANGGTP